MLIGAMDATLFPSRRRFLGVTSAASLTALLPSPLHAAPVSSLLATESYIWEQYFDAHQLSLEQGLPRMFAGLEASGYRRMEIAGDWLTPERLPLVLRLSRRHGVDLPFIYADGVMHERAGAERTIARVSALVDHLQKPLRLEAVTFNPAFKPANALKSPAELALQADALNRLGQVLKQRGVRLFLHAHAPEMRDHAREWRHNLHHTDPALVSICADVNWMFMGGQDPLTLLREAGPRVASLHVRNSSQGVWLESLDENVRPLDVDYQAVAALLHREKLTPWLVVELAYAPKTHVTRSLTADLTRSRHWTEQTFRNL